MGLVATKPRPTKPLATADEGAAADPQAWTEESGLSRARVVIVSCTSSGFARSLALCLESSPSSFVSSDRQRLGVFVFVYIFVSLPIFVSIIVFVHAVVHVNDNVHVKFKVFVGDFLR